MQEEKLGTRNFEKVFALLFPYFFFLPRLQLSYSSILSSFANLFLSFVFSTIVEIAGKYTIFSYIFHMLGKLLATLTNSSFACWFSRKVKFLLK